MAEGNGLLNRHTGDFPYRGFESLPLRINLNPALAGFLIYTEGVKQTALLHVGIRKPEPYPSLNEVKGEDGEAGSRAPNVSKATCDRISPLKNCVVFKFMESGTTATACRCAGIRSPQCYASLSEAKGEHHEGRPERKIRQDFYWDGESLPLRKLKSTQKGAF